MTIQKARSVLAKILKELNYPPADLSHLVSFVLDLNPVEVVSLGSACRLTPTQESKLDEVLEQLSKNTPVAYILGYQDFLGYRFKVGPGVHIPKVETELLVELAIKKVGELCEKLDRVKITEIGCGSGNISIPIIDHFKNRSIEYLMIEPSVLANNYLKYNLANLLGINMDNKNSYQVGKSGVNLLAKNLDGAIKAQEPLFEQAHVVLANPPYVPWEELANTDRSVRDHEPSEAIFADNYGTKIIEQIIDIIVSKNSVRYAIIEIDHRSIEVLEDLLFNRQKSEGFSFIDDVFGRKRFLAYDKPN